MIKLLKKLYLSDKGATAVEYGLIVSLVVIACIAAFTQLSDTTINMWNRVADQVTENS